MLAFSSMLGLAQVIAASHAASLQRGYRWTGSARDGPTAPLTAVPARLARALNNFCETYPFFAAAVLAVHVADSRSELSVWGSSLYFWARLAYVPLYAMGVPIVRSLVWNVAFIGIALLIASVLRS